MVDLPFGEARRTQALDACEGSPYLRDSVHRATLLHRKEARGALSEILQPFEENPRLLDLPGESVFLTETLMEIRDLRDDL